MLHYSTLSTMLWIGVTARNIYKQVTKKALPCPVADQPPFPKKPLLRYPSPLLRTVPSILWVPGTLALDTWFTGLGKFLHQSTLLGAEWGGRCPEMKVGE